MTPITLRFLTALLVAATFGAGLVSLPAEAAIAGRRVNVGTTTEPSTGNNNNHTIPTTDPPANTTPGGNSTNSTNTSDLVLFIAGGNAGANRLHYRDSAAYPSEEGQECPDPAKLPLDAQAGNSPSFTIDGQPVVCGLSARCYHYNGDSWEEGHRMTPGGHDYDVAANFNVSTAWVTGGVGGPQYETTSRTKLYSTSGVEDGPALPHATAHHCLVEIEEAYFVLAGGADLDNGVYHDTVDLYDFDDEQWYTAPAMAKPLWGHACGVVHDGNGGSSLIVTGGQDEKNEPNLSTYILNLETLEWHEAEPLSSARIFATSVPVDDFTFLIAGGQESADTFRDDILQFDSREESWKVRPEKLANSMRQFHATMVDPDLLHCDFSVLEPSTTDPSVSNFTITTTEPPVTSPGNNLTANSTTEPTMLGSTALFIAGGNAGTDGIYYRDAAAYSSEEGLACPDPAKLPLDAQAGNSPSFTINGEPVVCGLSALCYHYNGDSWDNGHRMTPGGHDYDVAVNLNATTAWVTGGVGGPLYETTSRTKLYSADGVLEGPALLHATAHHCLAKIEDAFFVLAGGADLDNGVYYNTVDLYDFDDEQWYMAPAMEKRLWGHACGVVHDRHGGSFLVVTGGQDEKNEPNLSTYILDLETFDWHEAEPLSSPRVFATSVPVDDTTFLIAGGQETEEVFRDDILQFNARRETWEARPERLARPMRQFHATMVDSDLLQCDISVEPTEPTGSTSTEEPDDPNNGSNNNNNNAAGGVQVSGYGLAILQVIIMMAARS